MKRVHLLIGVGLIFGIGLPVAVIFAGQGSFSGPPGCGTPPCSNVPGVIWNSNGASAPQVNAQMDFTGTAWATYPSIKSDLGLSPGKAFRVDATSATSFNMGNWGNGSQPLTFTVNGGLAVQSVGVSPSLGTDGRMQAYKYCFDPSVNSNSNDCITSWPSAGGYVLKTGDTMTGPLAISMPSAPAPSANVNGLSLSMVMNPSSVPSWVQGGYFSASVPASYNKANLQITGVQGYVPAPAGSTLGNIYGVSGDAQLNGSTVSNNVGVSGMADIFGNSTAYSSTGVSGQFVSYGTGGSVTYANGVVGSATNDNTSNPPVNVGTLTGVSGQAVGKASNIVGVNALGRLDITGYTASNVYGVDAQVDVTSGTATNAYGVQASITRSGPGVITNGYGVYSDVSNLTSGTNYAVYGKGGTTGVYGLGTSKGVYGEGGNWGVFATGTNWGLQAYSNNYGIESKGGNVGITASAYNPASVGVSGSGLGKGVFGLGGAVGVYGQTGDASGMGVYGIATGSGSAGVSGNGTSYGVIGNGGSAGYGVWGSGKQSGVYGTGTDYGVFGQGTTVGVSGNGITGVQANGTTYGVVANGTTYGVTANSSAAGSTGVYGNGTGLAATGVKGAGSTGVRGDGTTYGVYGASPGGYGGYFTGGPTAVYANGTSYGVYGNGPTGVYGNGTTNGVYGNGGTYGVTGNGVGGVYGIGTSWGVYGTDGPEGAYLGYAGYGVYSAYKNYFASMLVGTSPYWGITTNGADLVFRPNASAPYTGDDAHRLWFQGGSGSIAALGFNNWSDARLKDIKNDFSGGLDVIEQLQPKNFTWKSDAGKPTPALNQVGFIAQDVQKVLPDAVGVVAGNDNMMTLNYTPITAALVNAVKEQQVEIKDLQAKNADLEARISEIEAKIK